MPDRGHQASPLDQVWPIQALASQFVIVMLQTMIKRSHYQILRFPPVHENITGGGGYSLISDLYRPPTSHLSSHAKNLLLFANNSVPNMKN